MSDAKTEWSQADRRWLAGLNLSPEASGLVCRGSEEERRRCIEIVEEVVADTRHGLCTNHSEIIRRIAGGRK